MQRLVLYVSCMFDMGNYLSVLLQWALHSALFLLRLLCYTLCQSAPQHYLVLSSGFASVHASTSMDHI